MAQRRMFSLQIVDTDAFLDMPASSQLLYFHLSMRADDDGFVGNHKKVLRMIGGNEDDLKVLLTKRFLLAFESGVVVIKHWKIHNYIQSDRYHETKYVDEKNRLITKENGAYTECIQDVSKVDTKVRLGKVRLELGKVREEKTFGEFGNVVLSEDEYTKLISALGEEITNGLIAELSGYMASTGKKYKSHYATLQNWARRKIQEHNKSITKKGKGIIL